MKNKTKKRVGIVAMMLLLIVAIGATAGNTLAKYISSATVTSQTATVAQWGYTISANVENMFGEEYGDVTNSYAKVDGEGTVVASSESGKNVVAPGTRGYMTVSLNGTAEVNAVLTIKLDATKFSNIVLSDGTNEYYPLNWYVGGVKVNADNETAVTMADFATAIETVVTNNVVGAEVAVDEEYTNVVYVYLPANTSVAALDLSISWKWAIDDGSADKDNVLNDTNVRDTLLGLIAYNRDIEKNIEYSELPANVQAWLLENNDEAAAEALEAAAEALEAAENVLGKATDVADAEGTTAYAKYNAAKATYEEALRTYETAEAAFNTAIANGYTDGDAAYIGAKEAYDNAVDAYKTAVNAYNAAVAALEAAVGTYETAVGTYETAVETAMNAYLTRLTGNATKTTINYGLSLTVEQVQVTSLEDYLA